MPARIFRGFGLIEIVVTLGVLSVGILGVAALHAAITRQSMDNKSRAEALALAQSRIEEMRNYTSSAATSDEFNLLYPDTIGFANTVVITGTAAEFTRSERIAGTGHLKTLDVRVVWTSPNATVQDVILTTEFAFVLPRSQGDAVLDSHSSLVDSPTGRARPGAGLLPPGAQLTANGDGTSLYMDGGSDLMLVYDDQIVLTLTEACQTEDGTCTDFARIRGSVYIDKETQNNLIPGSVFILASDTAFCARYFTVAGTVHRVTPMSATTLSTPSGDYDYFHYTCYVGGGWHGNIGVILARGLKQTDKICMGDPIGGNAWENPVIAFRRVYRGMLFKHDVNSASGKEEINDNQGGELIRYYSKGIGDGIELPVPDTEQQGHDFIVASMPASETSGSACSTQAVMLRPDSALNGGIGDRFAGMPTDFFCLNQGYLDIYDTSLFGHTADCPFNPSDPPAERHLVQGMVTFSGSRSPVHDVLVAAINVVTSDGPGNCLLAPFTYNGSAYSASYQCDVYDWGNGWNGYTEIHYNAAAMSCSPMRLSLTKVRQDQDDISFSNCTPGSFVVFSGTVAATTGRRLDAAAISGGGNCSIADDGLNYQCISQDLIGPWTGTLSFTPNSGVICSIPAGNGIYHFENQEPGYLIRNLVIAGNQDDCN